MKTPLPHLKADENVLLVHKLQESVTQQSDIYFLGHHIPQLPQKGSLQDRWLLFSHMTVPKFEEPLICRTLIQFMGTMRSPFST